MSLIRTIDITTHPSQRLLQACATFGLAVRTITRDTRPTFAAFAQDLLSQLQPGDLVLIQGPSGHGKSTLLAELARLAPSERRAVLHADPAATDPRTPLIDLIDLPLPQALRTLAHAGLADATMLSRSLYQLSEGERFRLRLAHTLAAAQRTCNAVTLVIDEFASTLDRPTARALCFALRRHLSGTHAPSPKPILLARDRQPHPRRLARPVQAHARPHPPLPSSPRARGLVADGTTNT